MPRKIPSSGKKKTTKLKHKRAIKRGDELAPTPEPRRNKFTHTKPTAAAVDASRRLKSAFVKLPKEFLAETQRLADALPLPRPVPPEAAIWQEHDAAPDAGDGECAPSIGPLTCPRRPKWRYGMSKNEVEKNEEGFFAKWLDQTDALIGAWNERRAANARAADGGERMPSAPTSFERNPEVWRQLWRVTEISQILLILLDSRCPLLHYPPSLAAYFAAPQFARKRLVLVLTKVDIAGPVRTAAWTEYLRAKHPDIPVVAVEAYAEKSAGEGSGQRKSYASYIPSAFRQNLVDTLRKTHAALLEPPDQVKADPNKLKTWKPSVKRDIDWDLVMTAHGGHTGSIVSNPAAAVAQSLPRQDGADASSKPPAEGPENSENDDEADPNFLTIGLIGQPNVGKSSLLNALFGTPKVRASKAPGKTKHFQTLFWTPEIRLVDCPGIVMPNYVPMETQVLAGVLQISHIAAVPLCVYHAARLLPLEELLELQRPAPADTAPPAPDKRTWRTPHPPPPPPASPPAARWTAMDILLAYALQRGWLTAMAGRPDISRAGNAILRSLAEGRISWAFWPPGTPPTVPVEVSGVSLEGKGIWIPSTEPVEHFDEPAVAEDSDESSDSGDGSEDDLESDEEPVEAGSRFSALALDEEDEDEDDSTEDEAE